MVDVSDLRGAERWLFNEWIRATFGTIDVTLLDLAEQGAQIEHVQPIRLGSRSRLAFRRGDLSVAIDALVIWSHLSQKPSDAGKFLYQSGLRIEDVTDVYRSALLTLIQRHVLRRDAQSLERKRLRIEEKEHERSGKPVMKIIGHNVVSPDQALLIQHARERLRANPDEAVKWYNRARYALAEDSFSYREDVLAVWEYLERSVDLATIVKVFEKKN